MVAPGAVPPPRRPCRARNVQRAGQPADVRVRLPVRRTDRMQREHGHDGPVTGTDGARAVQRRPGQIHVRGGGRSGGQREHRTSRQRML